MRIQIHRRRGDKAQRLEAEGPPKSRDRQLPDLPSFDDLPEVCRQPAIVISKHLVKSPLALVRSLPSRLFALSSFDLVLLRFDLKIGHYRSTPRDTHNPPCETGIPPVRKDGCVREILRRAAQQARPSWTPCAARRPQGTATFARCFVTALINPSRASEWPCPRGSSTWRNRNIPVSRKPSCRS